MGRVLPYQANPYQTRATLHRSSSTTRPLRSGAFLAGLGDDDGAIDFASLATGPIDSPIQTIAPDTTFQTPGVDMNALAQGDSGQDASVTQILAMDAAGTGAPTQNTEGTTNLFDAAAAATAAPPAATAAAATPAAANAAQGKSSNAANNSSFDWSKAVASALTAGGAATSAVFQGRTQKSIAQMQANQASYASQAATALKSAEKNLTTSLTGALAKMPSWLPWAVGGGTLLLITISILRRNKS